MTTTANLLVLVDLDGTLVRGNSFHMWLRHMLTDGLKTLTPPKRYVSRLVICIFAALRLGRVITHARLKQVCQGVWNRALTRSTDPDHELNSFLAVLMRQVDPRIRTWIGSAQTGGAVAVLTTAAPGDYALPLARRLGFDGAVATPRVDSAGWSENLREEKERNTVAYVRSKGWDDKRTILFTDHIDDLPLMQAVQEVCLVADDATHSTIRDRLNGATQLRTLEQVVGHAG